MKTIYIIGFMGTGKTTVGKLLAEKIKRPFYDTDHWIEQKTEKNIAAIFQEKGENYFRQLETIALQSLPNENAVISTGGGIILQKVNLSFMLQHGIVIYLHTSFQEIIRRLKKDSGNRPLIFKKTKEEIYYLFKSRESLYEKAHLRIKTDNRTPNEITEEIVKWLSSFVNGYPNNKKT